MPASLRSEIDPRSSPPAHPAGIAEKSALLCDAIERLPEWKSAAWSAFLRRCLTNRMSDC